MAKHRSNKNEPWGTMGQPLKRMHEHLKNEQEAMCRGTLITTLMLLTEDARAQGISCGVVAEVGGGVGGLQVPIGPYLG